MSSRGSAGSRRSSRLSVFRRTPWILSLVIAGGCLLGFGLLASSTPVGRQALVILRFTLGWVDVAQQQQQFVTAVEEALQSARLPVTMHRRVSWLRQRRGQETWYRQTHVLHLPSRVPSSTIEAIIRDVARRRHHTVLVRRKRVGPARTEVTLVVRIAGLPTDIFVLTPPRVTTSPLAQRPEAGLEEHSGQPIESRQAHDRPLRRRPPDRARVAIVIDDLGWDLEAAHALLALGEPLSFAILPDAPYRDVIAREAQRAGLDVLLHMPMEPYRYPDINPGRPVLLSTMSAREIANQFEAALASLPSVSGVNNHMGSRLTENRHLMQVVMRQVKHHDLFFLDSRTTRHSLAYQIAQQMGVPTAQRHVFLDHDMTAAKINAQFRRLARLAYAKGSAIGIGHPYSETIRVLRTALPKLHRNGIAIVPVSSLVR
jgi:polysaccharide deacetylase 2 family uncharacterized protein YibQ